jgi:hypothetical protein
MIEIKMKRQNNATTMVKDGKNTQLYRFSIILAALF